MSRARTAFLAAALGCALCSVAAGARGGEPSKLDRARAYFKTGVRAYAAGQYADAVKALQQAYDLTPRDGLLFSLAQAYRKQYYASKKPEDLRAAIDHYRQYLGRVKQGGRRTDAVDALAELEPFAAQLEAAATPIAPPESKPVTQVMISSATPGVRVELDGEPRGTLPFVSDVTPGKHRVRLSAPGYQDYVREISVLEGQSVPLDEPLDEAPARLSIVAPNGSRVAIDGNFVGTAPLLPLPLTPGRHFMAVTANGHQPFTRKLALTRGEAARVEARLPHSGQRTVAYVLLGAGATGFVASGVFALAAFKKQSDARAILDRREHANISNAERDSYSSLRGQRDDYRTASLVAGGAGLALGVVGLALYSFDEPVVETPPPEGHPAGPAPAETAPVLELSTILSPDGARAALHGRF